MVLALPLIQSAAQNAAHGLVLVDFRVTCSAVTGYQFVWSRQDDPEYGHASKNKLEVSVSMTLMLQVD